MSENFERILDLEKEINKIESKCILFYKTEAFGYLEIGEEKYSSFEIFL